MAQAKAKPAAPPDGCRPETLPIEDYALIGDTFTAALVGKNGSVDWWCVPRFDSDACFAALLGTPDNGRWRIAPEGEVRQVSRRYRGDTLILDTTFETIEGAVLVTDFMSTPSNEDEIDIVRIVKGLRGTVHMAMELVMRFDYGHVVPWVRRRPYGLRAVAGPHALQLTSPVALQAENFRTMASFAVEEGQCLSFALHWTPSHKPELATHHPEVLLEQTVNWWERWTRGCRFDREPWRDAVVRSLITLKGLTYSPTGGIVAAPTASLPELIGGERNWDYRYCWIRDATFTLYSLLISGYKEEALAWRGWLLRSAAGRPEEMQIMYGLAGERRLTELEMPWLRGYEDSRPVRIGNGAFAQFQLDVYGELMDALHVARHYDIEPDAESWRVQRLLMNFIGERWTEPDEGIWEVRGPRRHFTHSKLMAWVGVDRAIAAVERYGQQGPVDEWRRLRARIRADILENGFSEKRNAFVQSYGSQELDASLLMLPLVGFLEANDPRVIGTVEAIQRDLMEGGLVLRYRPETAVDGVTGGEGAFLACSFWLADNLALIGRQDEAQGLFEHLLSLRNDVGLLAEEYDPVARRQLGNFPQAFSHVGLVNTAHNLSQTRGPAERRASESSGVGMPSSSASRP